MCVCVLNKYVVSIDLLLTLCILINTFPIRGFRLIDEYFLSSGRRRRRRIFYFLAYQ